MFFVIESLIPVGVHGVRPQAFEDRPYLLWFPLHDRCKKSPQKRAFYVIS